MAARKTFARAALLRARAELEQLRTPTWPSAKWRQDPAGFCRDVLGMALTPQQVEIATALAETPRVAVRAGRKLGKSEVAAMLALWFYCSFPGASVYCIAPTAKQVEEVVWKAIRTRAIASKIPIGKPALKPETGLKSEDLPFRKIIGFSSLDLFGFSGDSLYIVDEACDVHDRVFETIVGNQAGGGNCKFLAISNPTRTAGYFADCFNGRKHADAWRQVHLSALDSPNVIAQARVIPHMADAGWVENQRLIYGEDSPFYQVNVLGNFVASEQGRVIPYDLITEAVARWETTEANGGLHIGLDPAGPGSDGDETAAAIRRGNKLLALRTMRGLDTDGVWDFLRMLLREFRKTGERPVVTIDAGGAVGEPLATKLKGISNVAKKEHDFTLICVRANHKARRQPNMYGYVRDELWACLCAWLRDGGALLNDDKLIGELAAPMWDRDIKGLSRVEPKEKMRETLGRSPDRCDALALAVWASDRQVADAIAPESAYQAYADEAGKIDPYSYSSHGVDPYSYGR